MLGTSATLLGPSAYGWFGKGWGSCVSYLVLLVDRDGTGTVFIVGCDNVVMFHWYMLGARLGSHMWMGLLGAVLIKKIIKN